LTTVQHGDRIQQVFPKKIAGKGLQTVPPACVIRYADLPLNTAELSWMSQQVLVCLFQNIISFFLLLSLLCFSQLCLVESDHD